LTICPTAIVDPSLNLMVPLKYLVIEVEPVIKNNVIYQVGGRPLKAYPNTCMLTVRAHSLWLSYGYPSITPIHSLCCRLLICRLPLKTQVTVARGAMLVTEGLLALTLIFTVSVNGMGAVAHYELKGECFVL
jgi:hypothetical protein